jgi:hypothetical protein
MDTIAELERQAAVHEATRAELQRGPWHRRKDAQMADLLRLAYECRRKANALRARQNYANSEKPMKNPAVAGCFGAQERIFRPASGVTAESRSSPETACL